MRKPFDHQTHSGLRLGLFCSHSSGFSSAAFFFNPSRVMIVLEPVQRLDPIGYDLMMMVSHATAWLEHTISPFASFNNFPPFATLLFTLVSMPTAYSIITLITLVGLLWSGFVFPYLQQTPRGIKPVLVLIFTSAIVSYGLQFEIERCEFYTLAFALAFSGVYIFHHHPRLSWVAYIIFTLAIQLKMFPALLIFLFIRDWRDWRGNLLRIFGLGLVNIVLIFILGWNKFQEFVNILFAMNEDPGIWVGNFSVRSFTHHTLPVILKRFDIATGWFENGGGAIEALLLGLVVLLVGLGIYKAFRRNRGGIDPYLLFLCTAVALVIPPISHDYKLPVLAGPAAFLLMSIRIPVNGKIWSTTILAGATLLVFARLFFHPVFLFDEITAYRKQFFSSLPDDDPCHPGSPFLTSPKMRRTLNPNSGYTNLIFPIAKKTIFRSIQPCFQRWMFVVPYTLSW